MPILTGIDILGIQGYVFASNRLRDVLSASWMVEHVASRTSLTQWGLADERVLLAAGGNAIVEFDTVEDAKNWTAYYTRWLHETAPGLDAAIAHRPYDGRPLAWGLKALQQIDLSRAKLERLPDAGQLGLSVTASCSVTGLPATDIDYGNLVSPRVKRLREQLDQARGKWDEFLPCEMKYASNRRAEFPGDLDHMGRSHGETSLLGIVHVDGNGIGRAIKSWIERCIDNEIDNAAVRKQYGEWSSAITELGRDVLRAVVDRVAQCVRTETDEKGNQRNFLRGTPHELGFALRDGENETTFLPLRPILLGGDDLTFACNGRIACDLAATALREFERRQIPHLAESGGMTTLTACAGVALVKAHAPFDRSYELAENLCRSAKIRQNECRMRRIQTGSWLDWHAGTTRPGESVEEIRRRQYKQGTFTMRPFPVMPFDGRLESWDWLDEELLGPGRTPLSIESGFRGAPCWAGSRNRVKKLRSLVPEGRDAVKRQVDAWKATEPGIQMPADVSDDGFICSKTPLLDAIELIDLHVRLEPDARSLGEEFPPQPAEPQTSVLKEEG